SRDADFDTVHWINATRSATVARRAATRGAGAGDPASVSPYAHLDRDSGYSGALGGGRLLWLIRRRFLSRHVLGPELLRRWFRGRRYRRAVFYSRASPASTRCFLPSCSFADRGLAGRHLATSCLLPGGCLSASGLPGRGLARCCLATRSFASPGFAASGLAHR